MLSTVKIYLYVVKYLNTTYCAVDLKSTSIQVSV